MFACYQESHAVLAQASANEKSNEISAFPVLVGRFMDLYGIVGTADALHTRLAVPIVLPNLVHAKYLL